MDARAVAEVAEIAVGTLNVWVQRDLIPGMTVGARGRQRDFDLKTATDIVIMAALVRFGFGAPAASYWAHACRPFPRLLVAISAAPSLLTRSPERRGEIERLDVPPVGFTLIGFEDDAEVPDILEKKFQAGRRPGAYLVIDAERLRERTRLAFEQWEQSRQPMG
jgi:hypothetical protein